MDALKNYCLPYHYLYWIVGGFSFLEIAVLMIYGMRSPLAALLFTVFVYLLGGGFLLNDLFLRHLRLFDRRMAYFKSQEVTDLILSDFQQNHTLFFGNLIMGEHYLIGKGCGLVVSYEEIRAMWIEQKYENGKRHAVLYVFCDDRDRMLCYLPGVYREEYRSALPEERNEYRTLCDAVRSMNPDVKICRDRQEVRTLFR